MRKHRTWSADCKVSVIFENMYDKAAVVLPVGLNANLSARPFLGILHKKNFLTKSLSNTLDRIGVTEIGLKSPRSRGVLTF